MTIEIFGNIILDDTAAHRLWLDRVKVHGPELLDALKQLARHADLLFPSDDPDCHDALYRAHELIGKLEGKQ